MESSILILTRHGKSFSHVQKALLRKIHGQKTIIIFDSSRFSSMEELLNFHDEKSEIHNFIYYVLPMEMKIQLKQASKNFGVVFAPKKKKNSWEFIIVHHIFNVDQEIIKVNKKIPRKRCGSKSYYNVPHVVRQKTA